MRVCRDRLKDGSAHVVEWVDADVPTGCQCYERLWAIEIPKICNSRRGRNRESCKECGHHADCHSVKQLEVI